MYFPNQRVNLHKPYSARVRNGIQGLIRGRIDPESSYILKKTCQKLDR